MLPVAQPLSNLVTISFDDLNDKTLAKGMVAMSRLQEPSVTTPLEFFTSGAPFWDS